MRAYDIIYKKRLGLANTKEEIDDKHNSTHDKKSIENHIKNKYCTENDEVEFVDEFDRKIE